MKHFVSWIGRQDLEGSRHTPPTGPIVDFLCVHSGMSALLLSDWPKDEEAPYLAALRRSVTGTVDVQRAKLLILTDIGGVSFAHGLNESDVQGSTDLVTRLEDRAYWHCWEQYASTTPAFDREDPALPAVTGRHRVV